MQNYRHGFIFVKPMAKCACTCFLEFLFLAFELNHNVGYLKISPYSTNTSYSNSGHNA
jgi:hypothetical protein